MTAKKILLEIDAEEWECLGYSQKEELVILLESLRPATWRKLSEEKPEDQQICIVWRERWGLEFAKWSKDETCFYIDDGYFNAEWWMIAPQPPVSSEVESRSPVYAHPTGNG
jgi:hypothetical protein